MSLGDNLSQKLSDDEENLFIFKQKLLSANSNQYANRINEDTKCSAIHFATERNYVDLLRMLLENPAVNPNLQADHQTALHIAVSHDNLKCAELLLERGASPNVVNSRGLTPLHVAAMRKKRDMVKLIFDKTKVAPDLDSYRDYYKDSTRDVLKRMLPDQELPPPIERRPDVDILAYHLIRKDEESFLQCLDKISNITEIDALKLIEIATERNLEYAVSRLLTRGRVSCNLEKAADIAIQKNSPVILRSLLDKITDMKPSAANMLLLTACIELGIPGREGSLDTSKRITCLGLVLDLDQVDVNFSDEKGNIPLHYAARADNQEAVTMLLKKGSSLHHKNAFGSPAIL